MLQLVKYYRYNSKAKNYRQVKKVTLKHTQQSKHIIVNKKSYKTIVYIDLQMMISNI